MNYGLKNKVVLITGGSKGLGKCLVEEFKAQNCTVIFGNRDSAQARAVAAEFGADFIPFDMRDLTAVENLFAQVKAKYGRLDILVNNAALTSSGAQMFDTFDNETHTTYFEINDRGTFKCMQEAIKIMMEQETKGSIVNITSITSVRGGATVSVYAGTKGAINAITYAVANQYGEFGIRINAVMSGIIGTDQTKAYEAACPEEFKAACAGIPLKRVAEPYEIARPVLWLCSDDASYVQGTVLVVDGGTIT